ncbi:hypothetical protein ACIBL6_23020 [Streptomyces sp. NPDC050400]|uniref:hypothetical protein n=1 Tax=Streptomyces sp. NPDC050400 TaxID=3365610 RepID=UPI0037B7BF4A
MTPVWLGMPLPLASAVVAAAVALGVALLGPPIKYGFDKKFQQRKLDIEYAYEQQKELRNRIALYKGLLLETGGQMRSRLWNFFQHGGHGWLRMSQGEHSGYYIRSFSYRILCLVASLRLIERQAFYVDSVVATRQDRRLLEAMKLGIDVWTKADLFSGLPYDGGVAADHFLRDRLTDLADTMYDDGRLISLSEFEARLARDREAYDVVFRFLDGLKREEGGRYRFDRLVAVQLNLLATLNRFGYEYQQVPVEAFRVAANQCEHPIVLRNLCFMVRRYRLEDEPGYKELIVAADALGTRVDPED